MYKVMLIDDEKFIRKSLLNRVHWDKWGLCVEAEAENGVEALKKVEQVRPHIVFVDIRMPLMDGLEFIREARKRYSNVHYIITSAYDDFDYARQAITLGVDDYILKPVKVPEVEQILERTIHKLTEEELGRHLMEREPASGVGTHIVGEKVVAISFCIEEGDGTERIIYSELREFLEKGKEIKFYRLPEYPCIYCYTYLISGDDLEEYEIFEAAAHVWAVLGNSEGAVAWSEILPKAELKAAVNGCITLLKSKLFYPERKILRKDYLEKEREKIEEEKLNQIRHILETLYRQIPNGNYSAVRGELMRLPDLIVNKNNRINVIENCILELSIVLKRMAQREIDELEADILFRHIREKDYLLEFRTEEDLKDMLKELIRYVCETRERGERRELIIQIKEYIRNNYSENLSAAEISKVFFLNTSYLSTLFREKAGMTMKTYIEAVRMEKAKQMLSDKELSITDVAAYTGYSDPNYFSKVFRKYTGMSPRDYRDEIDAVKHKD